MSLNREGGSPRSSSLTDTRGFMLPGMDRPLQVPGVGVICGRASSVKVSAFPSQSNLYWWPGRTQSFSVKGTDNFCL